MEQRLSLITLGISDLYRARRFYEALGRKTGAESASGTGPSLPRTAQSPTVAGGEG